MPTPNLDKGEYGREASKKPLINALIMENKDKQENKWCGCSENVEKGICRHQKPEEEEVSAVGDYLISVGSKLRKMTIPMKFAEYIQIGEEVSDWVKVSPKPESSWEDRFFKEFKFTGMKEGTAYKLIVDGMLQFINREIAQAKKEGYEEGYKFAFEKQTYNFNEKAYHKGIKETLERIKEKVGKMGYYSVSGGWKREKSIGTATNATWIEAFNSALKEIITLIEEEMK